MSFIFVLSPALVDDCATAILLFNRLG